MPFILLIIGIVLIVYNYRAIKRNTIQFEIRDTEKSFEKVLKDNKDDLNDYKIEIGLLRKNLGESLTELQQEILEIKKELNMVQDNKGLFENRSEEESLENIDVISEINFKHKKKLPNSKKAEAIVDLIKSGKTAEEICHELSISKGEVLLVQELLKK